MNNINYGKTISSNFARCFRKWSYKKNKEFQNKKFVLRKEIPGGKFGVKKYKTILTNKYAIEILPPLKQEEIQDIAKEIEAESEQLVTDDETARVVKQILSALYHLENKYITETFEMCHYVFITLIQNHK